MSRKNYKKSIIFLSPTPPPYMGPTIATEIILNSRFIDEFNVIHLDTTDRRNLNNLGRIDCTNIYLALKHYFLLFQLLLLSKADLVYILISQTAIGFLRDIPFVLLSKLFKKKVVLHLRGGYFREFYDCSNHVMQFLIRRTLNNVDRMIVLGNCLISLFEGLIPKQNISVVPNGLDLPLDNCKAGNENKNTVTILFLSNFIKTKGFWEVLQSVQKVVRIKQNVRFVFAGSWINERDRTSVQDYLKDNEIMGYIEFAGPVTRNKKIGLLRQSDIFVLPTYYPMEGHPWVIVEAMAAGLPIITTEQGCIKESVSEGENGFLIPKKSADSVAAKIIYLIENPTERKKMGERSRKLYEANFTAEHFVSKMIEALEITMSI